MKKGIVWSYTKGEFVIFDHYYFSTLYNYLKENYNLEIPTRFNDIIKICKQNTFNTIIFNYPEKSFTSNQIQQLLELYRNGKTIIFLTYYNNEDNSSQISNQVLSKVGIQINHDEIIQEKNIHNNDKYLILTGSIHKKIKYNVKNILMPCSASVSILKKNSKYSYTELVKDGQNNKAIAIEVSSRGKIIAFGTCVFWDNFSISMYDNFQFTKNLLQYCTEV
ncbi:MAG: hypothetical protein ABDH21_00810 [bacterium]